MTDHHESKLVFAVLQTCVEYIAGSQAFVDRAHVTSHHERWLTLHCFKLVLCTLMAGKRFWNKVVASFRCSSPPKLFITTKGAPCT